MQMQWQFVGQLYQILFTTNYKWIYFSSDAFLTQLFFPGKS